MPLLANSTMSPTNNLPLAPTAAADHHVKACCDYAETLQIVAISLCAFVFLYAVLSCIRCLCRRNNTGRNNNTPGGPPEPPGLDPTIIAALPMYRYTQEGKADVDPVPDCAICLCEVNEGEEVKLLPVCMHLFHKDCIVLWLEKNRTCPVCRASAVVHRVAGVDIQIQ